jgi:asparagine synthetase B (glutamine-hydrolysing)
MWKVERTLIEVRHQRIKFSQAYVDRMRARYVAYRDKYGKKPLYYSGRKTWSPIPREFL